MRMLFDDELAEQNPENEYYQSVKADVELYHELSKTINSATVCDTNDVKYQTIDGDECAYVTSSYFVNENKSYSRTYETFVLRKDAEGNWKILVFYLTEGDSSDD
jgi:ketosteroid isomerase-like protein